MKNHIQIRFKEKEGCASSPFGEILQTDNYIENFQGDRRPTLQPVRGISYKPFYNLYIYKKS